MSNSKIDKKSKRNSGEEQNIEKSEYDESQQEESNEKIRDNGKITSNIILLLT